MGNPLFRLVHAFAILVLLAGGAVATEPDVSTLLPHAKQQPGTWRYTFEQPDRDWFKDDFDDSQWQSGQGGFGTHETPNTQIGTVWNTKEIWLRRSFTMQKPPEGEVNFQLHHDEDTPV